MERMRLQAIDIFRGFAILAMVLANYLAGVESIPPWLKHAPDVGLTVIDLVAPFFIFAIGLTYALSFRGRLERDKPGKVYGHFITRYLAILGIGAILSAGERLVGETTASMDWGVLQAIGVAGLLTLAVIRFPTSVRLIIGLGLLAVYQVCLDRTMLATVLASSHGGLFGSLAWSAMLIISTALADFFHQKSSGWKWLSAAGSATLLSGLVLTILVPVSKNRVSASYVLISTGISALLFLIFHFLVERAHWRGALLQAWGMNPLVLYVLHYLLIGIVYLPDLPTLYSRAEPWLVIVEAMVLVGSLTAVAIWMKNKKIILTV
jgi:predicted acyltransferase